MMGRPTKMTEQTIKDLRAAFLFGATKEEASAYAGISKVTLYNYIEKNPDFVNEIEAWTNDPILKAKRKVVLELESDTKNAQWYLERKAADFRPKSEVGISGLDETRDKLKDFFDDTNDDAYIETNAASTEPTISAEPEASGEVSETATDIS